MSHYNYKAHREYKALADLARRTGEKEEVIEEMEWMADYFGKLIGLGLPSRTKRKRTEEQRSYDGFNDRLKYEMGREWSQLRKGDD